MSSINSIASVNVSLEGVCLNEIERFLSREKPRPCIPVSSTLLQAIKRKITKKSFHPFHHVLTNPSSVLVSVQSTALYVSNAIFSVGASIINQSSKTDYTQNIYLKTVYKNDLQ